MSVHEPKKSEDNSVQAVLKRLAEKYDLHDISRDEDGVCHRRAAGLAHREGWPLLRITQNGKLLTAEVRVVLPRNRHELTDGTARGLIRREMSVARNAGSDELPDEYHEAVEKAILLLHVSANARVNSATVMNAFVLATNDAFNHSYAGRDSRDGEVWIRGIAPADDDDELESVIREILMHAAFIRNTDTFVRSVLEPELANVNAVLTKVLRNAGDSEKQSTDQEDHATQVTV